MITDMKKLMFAAWMLLSTSAAFAGDSEPLKAILKAQTYAEAADLLKANIAQITDNAEKAKAYDKLYELAMKKVSAEQGVQLENQTNQQMGKEGNKPVDEKGLYEAVGQAFGLCMADGRSQAQQQEGEQFVAHRGGGG